MRSTVLEYQFEDVDDALTFVSNALAVREATSVMRVGFSGVTAADGTPGYWHVRVEASLAIAASIAEPTGVWVPPATPSTITLP